MATGDCITSFKPKPRRCVAQMRENPVPKFGCSKGTPGFVYVLQAPNGLYKIGACAHHALRTRLVMLREQAEKEAKVPPMSWELTVVREFEVENRRIVEYRLHHRYESKNVYGEWFDLSDDDVKDLLSLTDDDIKRFHNDAVAWAIKAVRNLKLPTTMFRDM